MTLFTDPNTEFDPNKDYASELIGEGKRYADVKLAAKALADKDTFIEQLKRENAEMRANLKGEEKLDALLDKLKNSVAPPSGNTNSESHQHSESSPNQNHNTQSSLSVDDVTRLLEERDRKREQERNLAFATQKAREAFGANAGAVLRAKAEELGMSEQEMVDLAKVKPQAFLKLVEASAPATGNTSPKSSVNTAAMKDTNGNVRNDKYYSELRKKVGNAAFFKPEIQNQMMKDAQALGEDFYR